MLANRVRMGHKKIKRIPLNYGMANDRDFLGAADGKFQYIGSREYVIIPHIIKRVNVTTYREMFRRSINSNLKGLASDNPNVTDMSRMFFDFISTADTLDLSFLDTSNVTNMGAMFAQCSSLTSLDLSNFDTSNVTDMSLMFMNCSSLETLDLSSFDTSKVTNMDFMFNGCHSVSTAYARTQEDADRFNATSGKPSNVNFTVKG